MLIKNTDATYCKIKDIKVSGLEAYITMLVYSSKPQTTEDNLGRTSRVFAFYLKDKNTGNLTRLSNNNYWIDRCNNYNNDSNNVDINLYKEIILTVDISNLNRSQMLNNRWVRQCCILIIDQQNNSQQELWSSGDLELISQEIVIPIISNIRVNIDSNSVLHLSFNETFESQEDFNYTNSNIQTKVRIKSAYTDNIIEDYDISEYDIDNGKVKINSFSHEFNTPIIVEILVLNNTNQILLKETKFYNPRNNHKVFIKQDGVIKQINTCSIDNKQVLNININ